MLPEGGRKDTTSAFHCEFVVPAQELGVRLVTSDKRILEDFPSVAVSMDTFSSV
jgi:predicted nucleic acid-binding protein